MNYQTPSTFGELVRFFRKRSRLTQRQLATLLGVHLNTIGHWERGEVLPEQKGIVLELVKLLHLDEQESRQLLEASLTALAPYWSVPRLRNPLFTGREEHLEAIYSQLRTEQVVALTQSYAIHGLGGIGKTQLAVEYAYRYALEYTAIFWIAAERVETILSSFLAIADLLQLPECQEADQQRIVTGVHRWLSNHSKWLLIWDNVEEVELLTRYLPPVRQGAMLITTRRPGLGTLAQDLELPIMNSEEGMILLLRRAKILASAATKEQVKLWAVRQPAEYTAAQEVVKMLGGFPLALDQAGAYLETTQCRIFDYLQLLQSSPLRLLEEHDAPTDHPLSIAKTFTLAFEQLERSNPAAAEVLTVCAFLAPEAIPESLLLKGASYLGPNIEALAADLFAFQAALKALLSSSLIQRNANAQTLSLHRLVQVVLTARLPHPVWQSWVTRVTHAITHLFPFDENTQADYWTTCEELLPHAQQCLLLEERNSEEPVLYLPLMSRVATYLTNRARYGEAKLLFERAISVGEQAAGSQHPLVAEALHGQAELYRQQGEYSEAETLFKRALQIREQTFGEQHSLVASSLERLGYLYHEQSQPEQAERFYQQALRIWKQVLGPNHPLVAHVLTNLGRLYYEQGNELAEPMYQRALHIRERVLGPHHPQLAHSLNNLGILYYNRGKYELAKPLYQRALHIREQVLGPHHPLVAPLLNNLGIIYVDQGQYEQAEPLYQQALYIWEQAFGPHHPQITRPLNALGILYQKQGQYKQAEACYERTLHILEQNLGPEQSPLGYPLVNLGSLYYEQGQYELAEPMYQQALHIWEQTLGPEHLQIVDPLNGLANLARERGHYEQAEPLYQRALTLCQQHLGPQHPETAQLLHDLAIMKQAQGKYAEAASLYQRALYMREQMLGPSHPDTQMTQRKYASLTQVERR